jgi:alpha-glucosidase (family GH31 glycosyl hydrolase)
MKSHTNFIRQINTLLLSVIFIICLSLNFYGCSNQKNKNFAISASGQKIIVEDSTSCFEIEVYQKNLFKISYHHDKHNPVYEKSFATGELVHESVDLNISEYSDSVEIDAGEIKMIAYKKPFGFSFFNDSGESILEAIDINKKGEGHIVRFQMKEDDRFFGMGQKSISIDRRGHRFGTTNIHMGGYTKPYATQQVNIPYVYSPLGYGVLFDNTWPGTFDLGATNPEVWSYEASNGSFTFYVSQGENLQQLQKNYYELTGYPPLPPKWSFGLLQSKCGYENENVVDSIVNIFEKKQMPLDAIILDAYWFGGYKEGYPNYMGNFT